MKSAKLWVKIVALTLVAFMVSGAIYTAIAIIISM